MAALCMCLVFSKAHACLISTLDQKVDFHEKTFAVKNNFCRLPFARLFVFENQLWLSNGSTLYFMKEHHFLLAKTHPLYKKFPSLSSKKISFFEMSLISSSQHKNQTQKFSSLSIGIIMIDHQQRMKKCLSASIFYNAHCCN